MRIYFIGILIMCVPSINALGPEVSPRSLPNGINLPLVAQRALFLRIVEGWSKYPHAAPEYSSGDLRGAKVKAYAELAILEREQRLKDHKIVYLFDIFKGFSHSDLCRLIKRGVAYSSFFEQKPYAEDLMSFMRYSIAYEQIANYLKSNGVPVSEIYQKIEDMAFSTQES